MFSRQFLQRILVILLPPLLLWLVIAYFSWSKNDWEQSQWLTLYPLNGDQNAVVDEYIVSLQDEDFWPVEQFMNQQAERYLQQDYPVLRIRWASEIKQPPPSYPIQGNFFQRLWWSLQIRWWRLQLTDVVGKAILVQYYDPTLHPRLRHSLGLPELSLGVVQAYATPFKAGANQLVITHELMHLYGATDKYHRASGKALYPHGYAEPERQPLFPQRYGEIMATTIPLNEEQQRRPRSLSEIIVGPLTASEIGWLD